MIHHPFVRIVSIVTMILCSFLFETTSTHASSFDGDQTGALRESLDLEGCYAEQLALGSSSTSTLNDTLYVACNSANGIFVSTDLAETWSGPAQNNADFGAIIDVEASDTAQTAFMIGGITLYRTQDNGVTWEALGEADGLNDFGQNMEYANGTLISVYRQGGVVVSTDDGATLERVDIDEVNNSPSDFAYSSANDTWYALSSSSDSHIRTLYSSVDNGHTWTATSKSGDYSVIEIHPTNENYLILAGNDGVEYTASGSEGVWESMDSPVNHIKGIAIHADGRVSIGNWYTLDNGANWNMYESSVLLKGNFFEIDSVNDIWYIQSGRGLAKSTNHADTWTEHYSGITGATVVDISLTADKEVAWFAVYGGYVKSENFNSSITAGNDPTWSEFILPDSSIDGTNSVWVHPTNSDIVLATTSTIYRSTDGGSAWDPVTTDVSGSFVDFEYDVENSTLYLAYTIEEGGEFSGGVIKSTDDGATWTDLGMPSTPVNAITYDSTNNVLIAGVGSEQSDDSAQRGIYTYDGSAWTHVSEASDHPLYGKLVSDVLYVSDTEYVYAAVADSGLAGSFHGGLFLSTDGSDGWHTWSQVIEGLNEDMWGKALAAEPDGKTVYIGSARPAGTAYIFKCVYDGSTCGTFYTGLIDENVNVLLFDDFISAGTGVYRYKSKATLTVKKLKPKKNGFAKIRATLSDTVTEKPINKQRLKLYKKVNGKFRFVQKNTSVKTKNGRVIFTIKGSGQYQVRWTPQKAQFKAAYKTRTISKNIRIKK